MGNLVQFTGGITPKAFDEIYEKFAQCFLGQYDIKFSLSHTTGNRHRTPLYALKDLPEEPPVEAMTTEAEEKTKQIATELRIIMQETIYGSSPIVAHNPKRLNDAIKDLPRLLKQLAEEQPELGLAEQNYDTVNSAVQSALAQASQALYGRNGILSLPSVAADRSL